MYKLPVFNVKAVDKASPSFSQFILDSQGNWLALASSFVGGVGDVGLFYWNGENRSTPAGSVVAVAPTALSSSPTVAEAYDTIDGGNLWRRRAVGVLLSGNPAVGDVVRVRHFGRVTVDKAAWSSLTLAGQLIYLKRGIIGDPTTYGLMTPTVAETLTQLPVGNASYGPHVILRIKLVP
jgi:hypothetical protein